MKKLILLTSLIGAFALLAETTWVWTGAQDAYWTNAANWTVDGAVATVPPGRYKSTVINGDTGAAAVQTIGATDSIAEFPAVSEGRPTTIDVDGVWDVLKIILKSGAPRYVFGTSSTQEFCIYPNSGRFIVESGANGADVVARFGCGSDTYCNKDIGSANMPRIENWSTAEIDLKQFFLYRVTGWYEYQFAIYGTGNVRISGFAPYKVCQGVDLWQTGGAKLIIACDVPSYHRSHFRRIRVSSGYDAEIEILKDAVLSGYPGMGPFENISGTLKLTGEGEFRCLTTTKESGKGLGQGEPQNNTQFIYNNIKFYCKVTSELSNGAYGSWYHCGGTGTTEFLGENLLESPIQMTPYGSYVGATLRAATIGADGVASSIGKAPLHLGNSSRLLYTGAGEECTRTICLTNRSSKLSNSNAEQIPAIGVIEQGGTGKLTFSSPVKCACMRTEGTTNTVIGPLESATLILANSSEQAFEATTAFADDGDTKLNLIKRGTGTITFSGANTYTGTTTLEAGVLDVTVGSSLASSSGITFKGATLRLAASSTLPAVTISAGANTIELADGVALTVNGLTRSAGTCNIVTTGSATVRVAGATAATVLPDGVVLNGKPAEFDANGYVVARTYVITTNIPARGGVIPATAEVVGITTPGEETAGAITLAATTASMDALVQKTDTPATVALAEGQTLQADIVALTKDASDLTIGEAGGTGTLTAKGSVIEFDNASPNKAVTVNAAITSGKGIYSINEGVVRLTAASAYSVPITVAAGTVALSNDTQTTLASDLSGVGTFRKEGAATLTLSKNQSAFTGTFVVGQGILTAPGEKAYLGGSDTAHLVVTNGAQLYAPSWNQKFDYSPRTFHFAGTGPDGTGALHSDASTFYLPKYITLDGDALFTTKALVWNDTLWDMQGHALTSVQANTTWTMMNLVVTNVGPWYVAPWFASGNQWNQFSLSGDTYLGSADDPPIVATNGTRFTLSSGLTRPIERRILATIDPAGLGPEMSFTGGRKYDATGLKTNMSCWAGPIEVVNSNTWLSINVWEQYAADQYEMISGQISGKGGVNVGYGTKSGTKGHVLLAHPNNTYTGPTQMNGQNGSSINFLYPGSMPDWTKLTVLKGRVGLYWGEGLWDKASYLVAANAKYASWSKATESGVEFVPSTLVINTTYAPECKAEIALTDEDITSDMFSIGHDGEGALSVMGPFTKPIRFGTYRGELVFTGTDTITLGAGLISSDWNLNQGLCRIKDADDVRLTKGCISIGSYGTLKEGHGKLVIDNSKVTKLTEEGVTTFASSSYDSIMPGYEGRGIVEVTGNSVVTGRFAVGYGSAGRGALRVKGGRVTDLCASANSRIGVEGGSGAITVSGGFYDVAGNQYLGEGTGVTIQDTFYGPQATFTQTAGTTHIHKVSEYGDDSTGSWILANGANSCAAVYISGGVVTNERDTSICGGANTTVTFTMAGGEFVNLRPANPGRTWAAGTTTTIFNFNGGIFDSWDIAKAHTNSPTSINYGYANFNGGTYRTGTSGQAIFGTSSDPTWSVRIDRVTVYEKGATIEATVNNELYVPMSAPTGKGVASIPFTDSGDTFVGSPFVDIVGDGTGASAYAKFDEATGRITGIEVTSPGCDYTTATAYIRYGTRVWTNACTLADNVTTGGFTKKGKANLTLWVPNTYNGDTVLEEGTLILGCANAIPANSKLVFKGGSISTTTGMTLPPFNLKLTVGKTLTPASLTLAEGSTVTIDNLAAAEKQGAPYVLLQSAGGITGSFTLANPEDLPANWNVAIRGNTIRLAPNRGTVLIFR